MNSPLFLSGSNFLHPDPFQKLAWIRICSKLFWSRIIIFDWCENRSRKSSDTDPLTYLLARITRGRCSSYSITPLILYNKKQNLGYVVSLPVIRSRYGKLYFLSSRWLTRFRDTNFSRIFEMELRRSCELVWSSTCCFLGWSCRKRRGPPHIVSASWPAVHLVNIGITCYFEYWNKHICMRMCMMYSPQHLLSSLVKFREK